MNTIEQTARQLTEQRLEDQYIRTVRDVFAGQALGAAIRSGADDPEIVSTIAYKFADAMLKQRGKK